MQWFESASSGVFFQLSLSFYVIDQRFFINFNVLKLACDMEVNNKRNYGAIIFGIL